MTVFHYCQAQNIFTDLKSAEKRADRYYSRLSYSKAIHYYSLALLKKKNRKNYALNMKASELYKKMAKYSDAKKCFENSIATGYILSPQDSIRYYSILKACSSHDTLNKVYSAKKIANLMHDSLYYEISELPFNTAHSEYSSVSIGQGLFYVSDKESSSLVQKKNALNEGGFASLYYTEKKDSAWSVAIEKKIAIENVLHIGPVVFYDNQQQAIINVCVKDKQKPYRLLLYQAKYDSKTGEWSDIQPMLFNNKEYSVGHPAISEDGKTIFFVSDRKGGQGGTDIYYSCLMKNKWLKPINIGSKINTIGEEVYPFLSLDNVLFFSSDGRYGLGGLDIYSVDLDYKDTIVLNIGSPINSSLDDFSFNFNEKTKTGYFSSNRKEHGKQDDLYILKENKISLTVLIKDGFDKKELFNSKIQLWDCELNIPVKYSQELQSNIITAFLKPMHQYKMIIQKEEYRNDTLLISTYRLQDYSKPLLETAYIERKFIYYANLKIQAKESEGSTDSLLVVVVKNITTKLRDSIYHNGKFLLLKLDAECEYIITSRNKDTLRYIYIEKKELKHSEIKFFYNMYLSSTQPTVFRMIVKPCRKNGIDSTFFNIKVVDWVNGNEFAITPGPDCDFQFVMTDARLFDLYLNNKKIVYSKQELKEEGYFVSFTQ